MKVFTAYWLETAELPRPDGVATMAAHPLPIRCRSSPCRADDARHAPVRALLQARRDRARDDARAGARARSTQRVRRRARRPRDRAARDATACCSPRSWCGRRPHVPGDRALSHTADRAADEEAAEAGIADFLLVPGLSTDRLEHAIRYAITHQRTLQTPRRVRGAPRARAPRRQRRHLGLERRRRHASSTPPRWKSMLGYREHRDRRDARRVARPRPRRRPRAAHAGARRLR